MNVGFRLYLIFKLASISVILLVIPNVLLGQVPDTISLPADTLSNQLEIAGQDSIVSTGDSIAKIVKELPQIIEAFPASYKAGIWSWDRKAMLSSSALTLAELVELTPGIVSLKGGDYGAPETAVSFGLASGNIKIFWDGFEWTPLDTGVPDLSRITLAGIKEVRIERRMTGLRIELQSLAPTESIPETVIQIGTGDLGTNLLRAELVHPDVLGGSLTFAMDRLETRGTDFRNPGSLSGVGVRYALLRGSKGGLVAEFRSSAPQNNNVNFPKKMKRNDWNVRGRWRLLDGLIGEAFVGGSSLSGAQNNSENENFDASRNQLGARTSYENGGLWAKGDVRFFPGRNLQRKTYDLELGGSYANLLTVEGFLRGEHWSTRSVSSLGIHAVTGPFLGLSLFGSLEDGTVGSPFIGETEIGSGLGEADTLGENLERFTKQNGSRLGVNFSWNGVDVSAAILSSSADSLRPLGFSLEKRVVSLPGKIQNGYEMGIVMPTPINGFGIEGTGQIWEEEMSYLPKTAWKGALTYHGLFKESENLEVWGKVGVIGRDSMLLRTLESNSTELTRVAASQKWFAYMQVRIVTVNIFIRWENILGKSDNYDFPGLIQPRFRTIYGIRWVLNN